MNAKLRSGLGFSFVAMLILGMVMFSVSSSPGQTKIYTDPSRYIFDVATNGTIGTLFNVTVKVDNVEDMVTWQVRMYFNPTIISVTRWYEPTWDPEYVFHGRLTLPTPDPVEVKYTEVTPTNASAMVGSAIFPRPSVGNGFFGNGTLCMFQFNITAVPSPGETLSCDLDIDNRYTFWIEAAGPGIKIPFDETTNGYYELRSAPLAYDVTIDAYCHTEGEHVSVSITKDGVPTGYDTPHTFTDLTGSHTFKVPESDPSGHPFKQWSTGETSTTITVTSNGTYTAYYEEFIPIGTRLYVDPPEIVDPALTPCSTFDINITIDDVENMVVCEFNLTYDTNILSWAGAIVRRVQGKMPRTNMDANDDAGYIWMKLNYSDPVTTSDPIALVTIVFHVEGMGATPLDLHDTELLDPDGQPIDHEAEDGYFAAQIRDVAIINVVPSRTWAYQGWLVDITITAKNLGNVDETFDVKAYYDNNLIGTLPVVNLAPNTEINVTIAWDTSGVPEGVYTIKGEATTVPYEVDTTNNIYTDGAVQIITVIRDVGITSVVPARNAVYQGLLVDINVTAKNLGNVSETFDVMAYYDDNLIGTVHVVDLAPDAEIISTFTWNTSLVEPCINYTIKGEATTVPFEYDTTNNIYTDGTIQVKLLGDVDGDGQVDMVDVSLMLEAFGSYPGLPGWNPDADLDQDGLIDMADISILVENFGRSCSP